MSPAKAEGEIGRRRALAAVRALVRILRYGPLLVLINKPSRESPNCNATCRLLLWWAVCWPVKSDSRSGVDGVVLVGVGVVGRCHRHVRSEKTTGGADLTPLPRVALGPQSLKELVDTFERARLDRLTSEVDSITRRTRAGIETITLMRRLVGADAEAAHRTKITVVDGVATFAEQIVVPAEWHDLARVGVRFEIPGDLDRLTWFGPGPLETYPDRKASGIVSRWTSTIDEQFHPYVVPLEHGAHTDARWMALTDERGRGIVVGLRRRLRR